MPEGLKSAVLAVRKASRTYQQGSFADVETSDYIWLPSVAETKGPSSALRETSAPDYTISALDIPAYGTSDKEYTSTRTQVSAIQYCIIGKNGYSNPEVGRFLRDIPVRIGFCI